MILENKAAEICEAVENGCGTSNMVQMIQDMLDAEHERLFSMPRLMHACDALGVRADGENCGLLRKALLEA